MSGEAPGHPRNEDRHAAEWGLASVMTAGVLALMATTTLLFNVWYWNAQRRLSARELHWAQIGASVGLGVVGVACLLALLFGIVSLASAGYRRQPKALGVAGIVLSLLALLIWIIVGIDLLAVLDYLNL
jgi:hypothetical protein